MSEQLLKLKFDQLRRIQYAPEMSEYSRGYHAALHQVVKDIDRLLNTEGINHGLEGSRFDRPLLGFVDDAESVAINLPVGTGS